MNVESRLSTTAHGIPAPDMSEVARCKELSDAITLNNYAKSSGWAPDVDRILIEYCPIEYVGEGEIPKAVSEVLGFNSWMALSRYVIDDRCDDLFNLLLRYLIKKGIPHSENLGFIDGDGIGYTKRYIERLKTTLEMCFDAKYFYRTPRPLVYAKDKLNLDLVGIANAIHPGHWSYPAGHGTKFFTAVEVVDEIFQIPDDIRRKIFLAAYAGAMGRSGSLIHYPGDNTAGGVLTTLPEFA